MNGHAVNHSRNNFCRSGIGRASGCGHNVDLVAFCGVTASEEMRGANRAAILPKGQIDRSDVQDIHD